MVTRTRLADTILDGRSYARGSQAPLVDVSSGGQFGWSTDFKSWVSHTAHVRRNIIPLLVAHPRIFEALPADESRHLIATLKNLVENRAKTIDGLNAEITVDDTTNPFGGAGEEQEDVVNTMRARSEPSFTWTEAYNRSINAFMEYWITEFIADPITGYPNIVTRGGIDLEDHLPDMYTMSMIFIEPDALHRRVVRAWLSSNMRPKSGGTVEGRSDKAGGGETTDLSISFSAITQVGVGVNLLAQELLDEMNLTGANPNHRPAFIDKITEDVRSASSGYTDGIAAAAASAIQP